MTREFYSNGKLLITGEYVVLDGAQALAVPTSFGQSLTAKPIGQKVVRWISLDHKGEEWFRGEFPVVDKSIQMPEKDSMSSVAGRLHQLLSEANKLNPETLSKETGYEITTRLGFPSNWGLGSSSTLLNNISSFFGTDPYQLLTNTFGGSGYDIAAAQNDTPIIYQLKTEERSILNVNFLPDFSDELIFVHLNQKQDSRESIQHYRDQSKEDLAEGISKISALTQSFLACTTLQEFELLIEIHETLISQMIKIPKIKSRLFSDFPHAIKSLGGWGGDFILATGGKKAKEYFRKRGFETVLEYDEMVKKV